MTTSSNISRQSPAIASRTEVIIIDASVANWQSLVADLDANFAVILLPEGGNGLSAIALALAGYGTLDALHLVSHGGAGRLSLGNLQLNSSNLGQQGAALASIASHLTSDSDVLIYGCAVAQGDVGQSFVNALSIALNGADIAASTNNTGALALGGDWDLEYTVGQIETALPFSVPEMQGIGVLANLIVSSANDFLIKLPQATNGDTISFVNTAAVDQFGFQDPLEIYLNALITVPAGVTFDNNGADRLRIDGSHLVLNGSLTVITNKGLTITSNLSGSGTLTKTGTGKLTLRNDNNSNNFTGNIEVAGGEFGIESDKDLSSGTLTLNGGALSIGPIAQTTVTHPIILGPNGGTFLIYQSGTLTLSGAITGVGGLTKKSWGPANLELSGTNTYGGSTEVSHGTLTLSGGAAIPDASAVTVSSATLALASNETIGSLAGSGTVNLGSYTLTTGGDNAHTGFSGEITGTGTLVKTGNGSLALWGASREEGSTTINGGEVVIDKNTSIGTGTLTMAGGYLWIKTTAGAATFNNTIVISANSTFDSNSQAQDPNVTLAGPISGAGKLTKTGPDTLTLSGANTHTGAIQVDQGKLVVGGGSAIGDASAVTLGSRTTLELLASETIGSLTGSSGGMGGMGGSFPEVSLGTNTLTVGGDNTSTGFAGDISGTGGLSKIGSGTLTLSGVNTYSGATTVSAGGLTTGAANVIADSSAVSIASGATLTLGGAETIGSLAGSGTATLGNYTLTTGGDNTSTSFSGAINGSGGLTKTGSGTFTLSGTNTYTGTTPVNAGTLLVNGANSGSGAVSVATGATLGGTGSIAGAINLASGATLTAGTTSTTEDLATGNLALSGSLSAQIGGTAAGSGHDQIKVTGTVNLTGATLDASFISGFASATGNRFTLIDNDASDAVTGTFTGLAEGETLTVGGRTLNISYTGGTGNDVVLTDVTANVNTPPVLDASQTPTLPSVSAKASNPAGITVANWVVDDSITDADGSAVKAIAITALDARLGAWQYSLDNGTSWLTIRADLINSGTNELALLLGPTAQLRLLPFGGLSGTLSEAITFRAWDMSSGAQGNYVAIAGAGSGCSAFSSAADTASLTVTAVNDAPTFAPVAGSGKAVIAVGNYGDTGQSIAVQPDGKITVAGYSEKSDYYPDFSLIRLNANGTLDTSFAASTGGKLLIPIGIYHDRSHSVAVQADGKIVVAGEYTIDSYNTDFGVVRLNTDGTLDNSFAGNGKAVVTLSSGYDYGNSVTIQPDGKIILAGNSLGTNNAQDFSLIRLNVDGTLDTSFDGDGKAIFAVSPYAESGSSVTVQADGKIILAGNCVNPVTSNTDFSLIRLNANGSLDTIFGDLVSGVHTGKAIIDVAGSTDYGRSLTVQTDGKLILAGNSYSAISKSYDFSLVRLNADGSLDTSFGTGGKYLLSVGNDTDQVTSVVVQPDGKILFAGSSTISTPDPRPGRPDIKTSLVTLVRLNPEGELDNSFGASGIASMSAAKSFSHGYGLTLQPDGKIVVGYGDISAGYNFGVMRLNADGSLDTTFNGTAENTLGGTVAYTENAAPVALDTSVAIFDADLAALAGGVGNYSGASITLARHGGANPTDVFSAMGSLGLVAGAATLTESGSQVTVGSFTNTAGTLAVTFNSLATQARVNTVLSSMGYANSSDAPPASVQIDWAFNDGNTGAQGAGGASEVTGNTTVTITAVNDAPTISNVPGTAQAVTTGTAAALADFTVADVDGAGVILSVTLTASNGTINAVADPDTNTPGIQLTGTAAVINSSLAAATFTAAAAGAASISISVDDGLAPPVVATYSLLAVNAPPPVVVPNPVPVPTPGPQPNPEPTPPLPPVADDKDNIPSTIEDSVPGLPPVKGGNAVAGDGNGDGIPDSQQAAVTSLPILNTPTAQSAPGNATPVFVSLVAGSVDGKVDPTKSHNAQITSLAQQDAPAQLPVQLKMPLGLLNFSVSLQPNADNSSAAESFSLYVDATTEANGYWVQNANKVWCNLASAAFGGKMVLEGGKLRLDFQLVDGGEFDTDGLANGSVDNLGAAANMPLSLVGFSQATPDGGLWF